MADDSRAPTSLESLLRRDRLVTCIAIVTLIILASVYTVFGVGMKMSAIEMTPGLGQTKMAMPTMAAAKKMVMEPASWDITYAFLVFLMWWLMMIAMMLPSASPMILLYTALIRHCLLYTSPSPRD